MHLDQKLIKVLENKLQCNIDKVNKKRRKKTSRASINYVISLKKSSYLLLEASTPIEKFYASRSIRYQSIYNDGNLFDFKTIPPIYIGEINKKRYVLHRYYEKFKYVKKDYPLRNLQRYYTRNAVSYLLDDKTIALIKAHFLSAWPQEYHYSISRMRSFTRYFEHLRKYKQIELAFEHGDYTPNNIISVGSHDYLIDFEFCRELQPIGFDLYDYAKEVKKLIKNRLKIPYIDLHEKKYQLICEINQMVDSKMHDVVVFDTVDHELKNKWNSLYNVGADYNLSYEWCTLWMKYFSKGAKYHIVTIWKENEIILLAPLKKRRNRLSLIGSAPDLYDQFNVLTKDIKVLKKFCHYIVDSPYDIDFRYLNCSSTLAKLLVKELYQKKTIYRSKVVDTKPSIRDINASRSKKIRDDIKRCKNNAKSLFCENLIYQEPKNRAEHYINELIALHIKRWNGGPFKYLVNYKHFIKELYQKTELIRLACLRFEGSEKVVGIHTAYQGTNKVLYSNIPAYDKRYSKISPGKVLLHEVLTSAARQGVEEFDFGRGAEPYKYWFASEDHILFDLVTYKRRKLYKKLRDLKDKVKKKLIGE